MLASGYENEIRNSGRASERGDSTSSVWMFGASACAEHPHRTSGVAPFRSSARIADFVFVSGREHRPNLGSAIDGQVSGNKLPAFRGAEGDPDPHRVQIGRAHV